MGFFPQWAQVSGMAASWPFAADASEDFREFFSISKSKVKNELLFELLVEVEVMPTRGGSWSLWIGEPEVKVMVGEGRAWRLFVLIRARGAEFLPVNVLSTHVEGKWNKS